MPTLSLGVAAFFACRLSAVSARDSDPEVFMLGVAGVTALVGGIALLQAFGIAVVGTGAASLKEVALQGLRDDYVTYATLGHKNLVGSFVAMGMLLALGVAFGSGSRGRRRMAWVFAGVLSSALFLSHARTSQAFGFLLGVIGLLALFVWPFIRRHWKVEGDGGAWWRRGGFRIRFFLFLSLIGLLVLGGFVVSSSGWVAGLRAGLSLDDPWNAFNHRGMHWIVAWEMIRRHPFFGVGPGHFGQAYAEHVLAVLSRIEDPFRGATHANQAHSDPLQVLAELGWPGFFWVCGGVGLLFLRGIRFLKGVSPRPRALGIGLLLALGAFHGIGLFDFPAASPPHVLLYAMTAGTLIGMASGESGEKAGGDEWRGGIFRLRRGLAFIAVLFSVLLLFGAWRMRQGDRAFVEGRAAYRHGALDRAEERLTQAMASDPSLAHVYYYLGRIAHRREDYDRARYFLARAEALWPYAQVDVAIGYLEMDAGRPQAAVDALTRYVTLKPMTSPLFYRMLEKARAQAGLDVDPHVARMADPAWRVEMGTKVLEEGKFLEAYHWFLSLGNDAGRRAAVSAALEASDYRRAQAVLEEINDEKLRSKADAAIRRRRAQDRE